MSHQLISHSPDLTKLRAEGYDLETRAGFLLVRDVPYVTSQREVRRGVLVMALDLAGDVTSRPSTHVAYFSGEYPCTEKGTRIGQIENSSQEQQLGEGVVVQHTFSAKPLPNGHYPDYYTKVSTYVAILSGPAQKLEPGASAKTFPVILAEVDDDDPFHYIDTASSRAGIASISRKLAIAKVGVVGLGGTGAYVLDLIAKTPVGEIHLYDGDLYLQHNAFRSPGASSKEELAARMTKVAYYHQLYSRMRRGVVCHAVPVDEQNIDELCDLDFVFLCIDDDAKKGVIIRRLITSDMSFIDVGLGVQQTDGSLGGILRVTASTKEKRDHLPQRISTADSIEDNEYDTNIQIAELNALNAALAVVKWKKLVGFYRDLKGEHNSYFTIDSNLLANDDF